MSSPEFQSPVNPVSPVVVALFLMIIVIEAAFTLGAKGLVGGPGAVGWRMAAIEDYGFNSEILRWMFETGRYPFEHLIRGVTYPFVHGNFTHAAFAGVMLLALGKYVGDLLAQWVVLAVFLVGTIAGALVYGIFASDQPWLVGAFPGVYALIGTFTYLLWLRLGQLGEKQARAFTLIGFLMGIQLLFGLLFNGSSDWIADISAFVAGFVISPVLVPGGLGRLRDRLRHR